MRFFGKVRPMLLFFLVLFCVVLSVFLQERSKVSFLNRNSSESDAFRAQALRPELYEKIREKAQDQTEFSELLTATMLNGRFYPTKLDGDSLLFQVYKKKEYTFLRRCYEKIWSDLFYFPIPSENIFFENSFGAPREYGGVRIHEGCDLFGSVKKADYYPVLSMTDGVVEKVGWLPLGGYRIGIRAPAGGYFYYAHLSGYEHPFSKGERIKAGDILGYMGNTGYGKEGTTGQFPVHLHLGIYIETPYHKEFSVNPYWVLKAISKKIRKYSY